MSSPVAPQEILPCSGPPQRSRVELLAPAGDMDTLRIAVKNGADAVYFGARSFNARAKASNFDDDQLAEAVDFLHAHSARAYLAINTLIADTEMDAALRLAESAYRIGADALILQDVGLLDGIRRRMPGIRLFASTQMSIGNEPGILAARDLGISRVILPRELTMGEVRALTAYAAGIGVETEVFIHGALCVCFSGQCLMSALQGGRSANRGACAQPCRLSYRLENGDRESVETGSQPRMSLKDQSLYRHVQALVDTGVSSFKIEGRLRSPGYVGTAVAVYRRALDGTPEPEDGQRLLQAFNRGGSFTDDFLTDRRGPGTRSGVRPGSHGVRIGAVEAVRADAGILEILRDKPSDGVRPVPARGDVLAVRRVLEDVASAPAGIVEVLPSGFRIKGFHPDILRSIRTGDILYRMTDAAAEREAAAADRRKTAASLRLETSESGIRLTAQCVTPDGTEISASTARPAETVPPLPASRVTAQLSKSGQTPFRILCVSLDGPEPRAGVATLNAMRREVLDQLLDSLSGSYRRTIPSETPAGVTAASAAVHRRNAPEDPGDRMSGPRITVFFWTWPQDGHPACGADDYLFPARELLSGSGREAREARIRALKEAEPGCRVHAVLPPGLNGPDLTDVLDRLESLREIGLAGIRSRTLDIHRIATGLRRGLEPGGNTYNAAAFRCHADAGMESVALSHEAGVTEAADMLEAASPLCAAEIPVYGRIGVMYSHSCPVGKNACTDPAASGICLGGSYSLRDDRGRWYPVVCHPGKCTVDILSARTETRIEWLERFGLLQRQAAQGNAAGVVWRLAFYNETKEERNKLVAFLRTALQWNAVPEDLNHLRDLMKTLSEK